MGGYPVVGDRRHDPRDYWLEFVTLSNRPVGVRHDQLARVSLRCLLRYVFPRVMNARGHSPYRKRLLKA